jgi:uncharacterized protein (DUF934 family)
MGEALRVTAPADEAGAGRQVLRACGLAADEWTCLAPSAPDTDARLPARGLILPLDSLAAFITQHTAHRGPLGVQLAPADPLEPLLPHLARLSLIALHFPGPSEGRGYTQARLLRERHGFAGEIRATGAVKQDQLFLMARCGIDAFELAEGEDAAAAHAALRRFSVAYQPSPAGAGVDKSTIRYGTRR